MASTRIAGRAGEPFLHRLRRRFGRRTSSGRFIPEIDGLRFPAIAIVLVGHLCAFFHEVGTYPAPRSSLEASLVTPVAQSGKGVLLFFIISGFVLALPFVRHYLNGEASVRLGEYFLRRVTRLEPPYLISLTLFLLLKMGGRAAGLTVGTEGSRNLVEHYLASAAYLHNLVYGIPSVINGVAWSLEVEIQFYLLVPVLAAVFLIRSATRRRVLILGLVMISVVLQQRFGVVPNRWSYSIAGSLHFFLLGFLLADLYVAGAAAGRARRTIVWDVAALIGWPCLFLVPLNGFAFPAIAVVLFVAAFRGTFFNRVFSHPIVTTIGGMCYSIYLLHFMVIGTVGRVVFRRLPSTGSLGVDFALQAPVLLLIALTVSAVYFQYIELPCMNRHWPGQLAAAVRRRFGSGLDGPERMRHRNG